MRLSEAGCRIVRATAKIARAVPSGDALAWSLRVRSRGRPAAGREPSPSGAGACGSRGARSGRICATPIARDVWDLWRMSGIFERLAGDASFDPIADLATMVTTTATLSFWRRRAGRARCWSRD